MSDEISRVIREQIARDMDAMVHKALYGKAMTSTAIEPTTLNAETLLEDCRKFLFNMKREQITFVVDVAHVGPIMAHDTQTEGKRVEMSWPQAIALHKQWPIKLHNVLSPSCAEFVPVSGIFPEYVDTYPEPPPWQMPGDSEDTEVPGGSKG